MEIKPRFGHNLWYQTELGVNAPLIFLRIAKGEDPGEVSGFREGVLMLDPLSDLLHRVGQAIDQTIGFFRAKIRSTESTSGPFERESMRQLLKDYKSDYFSKTDRVTSPLPRGFFSDPFPSGVRICRTLAKAIQRRAA